MFVYIAQSRKKTNSKIVSAGYGFKSILPVLLGGKIDSYTPFDSNSNKKKSWQNSNKSLKTIDERRKKETFFMGKRIFPTSEWNELFFSFVLRWLRYKTIDEVLLIPTQCAQIACVVNTQCGWNENGKICHRCWCCCYSRPVVKKKNVEKFSMSFDCFS